MKLQNYVSLSDFVTLLIPVVIATTIARVLGHLAHDVLLFGIAGVIVYYMLVVFVRAFGVWHMAKHFGISVSDFMCIAEYAESEGYAPDVIYAEWSDMTHSELLDHVKEARDYAG
jgi:hypothetical protein